MGEAPSTNRAKSGGNRCPHSSVTDAKILLSQKGTIIDVDIRMEAVAIMLFS